LPRFYLEKGKGGEYMEKPFRDSYQSTGFPYLSLCSLSYGRYEQPKSLSKNKNKKSSLTTGQEVLNIAV
jgi:hypothetical protein